MKRTLFLFLLFLCYQKVSQSQTDLKLGSFIEKKNFISIKNISRDEKQNIKDFIVLDNDTLVNYKDSLKIDNSNKFCKCFTNDSIFNKYISALQFESRQSKQWNSEIIVYVDKEIPVTVKKNFIDFFKQIDSYSIENINVSFTNNFNDSNYWIKVSDTLILSSKISQYDNDEFSPHSRVSYNLHTDNNKKFYSGILLIDKSLLNNKDLALKKLKQLFFISLGPFYYSKNMPSESLLNPNYINFNNISEFDIKILETDYYKIYPQPFSQSNLFKMRMKAKTLCKDD